MLDCDLVDDPARSAASEPHRAIVTARRRRRWGEEAVLAGASLAAIGTFFWLSGAIGRKRANVFDRAVVRALGAARNPATNGLARTVTFFGSVPGATLVT